MGLAVTAETSERTGRLLDQTSVLVIADRFNIDASPSRQRPDGAQPGHIDSVVDYGLKLTLVVKQRQRAMPDTPVQKDTAAKGSLAVGGLAGFLASACCLGPFVLVTLGVSGAWIGNLVLLEPFRPIFIGVALAALYFAWRRIFRPVQICQPGEVCAIRHVRTTYKVIFWFATALVVIALVFPYVLPFFY